MDNEQPTMTPYTSLSIPTELADKVDEFIQKNSKGFKSRGEVTKAALREFLEKEGEKNV